MNIFYFLVFSFLLFTKYFINIFLMEHRQSYALQFYLKKNIHKAKELSTRHGLSQISVHVLTKFGEQTHT